MKAKKSGKVALKKKLKYEAIINAAIEVFSVKGFHRAKIKEIAHTAGVADGTVYLYFKTKDDLLISAFDDLIDRKLRTMMKLVEQEETSFAKLTKFFDYHVDLFTQEPYIARFLSIELRQSSEFYQKHPKYQPIKRYLDYLQEIIKQAIEEGSIRKVDPEGLSYIMFGTMDFVLTEWSKKDQQFSLAEIKDKIVDVLRYGYFFRD